MTWKESHLASGEKRARETPYLGCLRISVFFPEASSVRTRPRLPAISQIRLLASGDHPVGTRQFRHRSSGSPPAAETAASVGTSPSRLSNATLDPSGLIKPY